MTPSFGKTECLTEGVRHPKKRETHWTAGGV